MQNYFSDMFEKISTPYSACSDGSSMYGCASCDCECLYTCTTSCAEVCESTLGGCSGCDGACGGTCTIFCSYGCSGFSK